MGSSYTKLPLAGVPRTNKSATSSSKMVGSQEKVDHSLSCVAERVTIRGGIQFNIRIAG